MSRAGILLSRFCGGSISLKWLAGINLALGIALPLASLACHFSGSSFEWIYNLFALPASFSGFIRHPWTLATYMVAQVSPLHLLFNLLWLVWFGRMLTESGHGREFAGIYISGGLAGGAAYLLASALLHGPDGAFLIGSSASVMAVMTVTTLYEPNKRVNLLLIGNVRLKWLSLACVFITFIGAGGGTGIGQAAHLGGLLAGAGWWLAKGRVLSARRNRNSGKISGINGRAAANRMRNLRELNIRLDELLDKVRLSGYDSLSRMEKEELDYISHRIPLNTHDPRKH